MPQRGAVGVLHVEIASSLGSTQETTSPLPQTILKRLPGESGVVRLQAQLVRGWKSPQVCLLRPEAECNCVAKRRGGEQQEANERPVG